MEQNLIAALKIVMSKDFLTKLGNGVKQAFEEGGAENEAATQKLLDEARQIAEERRAALNHAAGQQHEAT